MSETAINSRERNKIKRDAEKKARKSANVAKVEETKQKREKDVWEKLQDEKRGINATQVSDNDSKPSKSKKTRKVKPENRLSHHHGHANSRAWCWMIKGKTVEKINKVDVLDKITEGYKPISNEKAKKAQA